MPTYRTDPPHDKSRRPLGATPDDVHITVDLASRITRFSPAEVLELATRRPPVIRSLRRGGELLVHSGDLDDCNATSIIGSAEPFEGEEDAP